MRRTIVIHPFVCAMFPVVSLLATNIHHAAVTARVLGAAASAALLAGAGCLALRALLGNRHKAGFVASAWALAVCSLTVREDWLFQQPGALGGESYPPYWLPLWCIFPVLATVLVLRSRGDMEKWTQVANAAALFLLVFPALRISRYAEARAHQPRPAVVAPSVGATALPGPGDASSPDIYYIILDRYASAASLKEFFAFDNSDMLRYLHSKGFYVAEESRSNYLKTALSLASSLNMGFLDHLTETMGTDSDDWLPAYNLLQNHEVGRFLKSRGYRYIHVGPLFEPTLSNRYADENYSAEPVNILGTPFEKSVLRNPTLPAEASERWSLRGGLRHWVTCQYQFEKMHEISRKRERKFVFAHILLPHNPYVFDKDGGFLSWEKAFGRSEQANYVEQLRYTNTQVKRLVDDLLGDGRNPPVVILQADEGPFPPRYNEDQEHFDWRVATRAEMRLKTGILNAYLLPRPAGSTPRSGPPAGLTPSITPVNSFRCVFNHLFKAGLPLLPDTVYAFRSGKHLYDFFDATKRVRPKQALTRQVAAPAHRRHAIAGAGRP